MEGIAFTAAVAILEALAAGGFAYRGRWFLAGMQLCYSIGNIFLILEALKPHK